METNILKKLKEIETTKSVEILFAVESGSRAWGFASPDSDYDIRFVYQHQADWYLNIWEQKDTIQFMTEDDLDGSGWDLRKALRLLAKSNASFLGWLFSPIVYKQKDSVLEELKALAERNFNPIAGFYHYHNMNKQFQNIACSNEVNLKDLLYALRTGLCARWIKVYNSIPPVTFKELYVLLDVEYWELLDGLVAIKSQHKEKGQVLVDPKLLDLAQNITLDNEIAKHHVVAHKGTPNDFNNLFIKYYHENYS